LNLGKFNNSADIFVLARNDDLHYTRKIGLNSRYCGLKEYGRIAELLPVSEVFTML